MIDNIPFILGGIGLYIYGMQVMTEALRQLASRSMRDVLSRFTRSAFSGAVAGAVVTALIQSSSATLLTRPALSATG